MRWDGRPLEHLQDSCLVELEALCLKLEPLFQFGDSLELLVLLIQQVGELLLVLACLP